MNSIEKIEACRHLTKILHTLLTEVASSRGDEELNKLLYGIANLEIKIDELYSHKNKQKGDSND